MAEEKSKQQLAQEWLGFTLKNWQERIRVLKIGDGRDSKGDRTGKARKRPANTMELYDSFKESVVKAAGEDQLKIMISYAWWGKMVDMGVGRGTKNGDKKDNATSRRLIGKTRGNARKPKRWYSGGRDGIGHQLSRLSLLLGEQMAYGLEDISLDDNRAGEATINL